LLVSKSLVNVGVTRRAEARATMSDDPTGAISTVTRRTALTGLGVGALGLAVAGAARPVSAQDETAESLQNADDVNFQGAKPKQRLDIQRPSCLIFSDGV